MTLNNAQTNFAAYVIGRVESNWTWNDVNLQDAITFGMWQCWGPEAAYVLERCKAWADSHTGQSSGYELLSGRILTALQEHKSTDSDFWEGFFPTSEDVASLHKACDTEGNHECQKDWFVEQSARGIKQLEGWGLDSSDPKRAILYLVCWWQSPQSSLNVLRSVGNSTLERVRDGFLADRVVGNYPNRYNTAYQMLAGWDGTAQPPDFGGNIDPDTPIPQQPDKNTIDGSTLQSQISYLELTGNDIVIHGDMSRTDTLLCHYNGNGTWYPVGGTNTSNPGTGGGGGNKPPVELPSDFPTSDWEAMKKLWENNASKWAYGQGGGRLNPPVSGYSDCSACIYWAANTATNNKYSWIGTWTGAMQENCPLIYERDVSGDLGMSLDFSLMQPGDMIILWYSDGLASSSDHVDWYWGDGVIWGAGTAPLPRQRSSGYDVDYYKKWTSPRVAHFGVYRFLTKV